MKHKSPIMQIRYEECGLPDKISITGELERIFKRVMETDGTLREKLADLPELNELFLAAYDAVEDMHLYEMDDCYANAFRFGFLLALDIMQYGK